MEETTAIQFPLVPLLAGVVLLFCRRSWVLPLFLAVTAFVSLKCRIYVGGLNFYTARILLVFAWARILTKGEHRDFQFLPFDTAFVLYCCSMVIAETLRRGAPGAL